MIDGEWESSPLKYAGENLIHSLVLVGGFVAALNWLLKGNDIFDFPRIINPIYLTMNLGLQAIIFAAIFWAIVTPITILKKKAWHPLYFLQVLQAYSVINFLVVVLFWIGMQWAVTKGVGHDIFSSTSMLIGGGLAIMLFIASFLLLIRPAARYLYTYFSKITSWAVIVIAVVLTTSINKHIHVGFNDAVINKVEFCEYLFKLKVRESPEFSDIKSCVIGKCIEGYSAL